MNSKKDNATFPEQGKSSMTNEENDLVIFSYSRAEAIADGVLIDVSELAKEAGFRFPVAMTSAAWQDAVAVPPDCPCQDETGRLWDVLNVLRFAIRANSNVSELCFHVSVVGSDRQQHRIELKSMCGPGDDAAPVITILLPDED